MSFDVQIQSTLGDFNKGQHAIVFDSRGRLITVSGTDKLVQDINKILHTNINYFYNEYKTQLDDLIGRALSKDEMVNTLARRIADALVYLQYLQQEQAKYQQVDGSEIIASIDTIDIDYLYDLTNNPKDLRTFRCSVSVSSAVGTSVTVSRNVTAA